MITEDYVSWETAKLMKSKGFDLLHFYGNWYHDFDNTEWMDEIPDEDKKRGTIIINEYSFPLITLQMAMKWLREVHNLWCEISWEGKGIWCMEVFSLIDEEFIPGSIVHEIKSYEEACEAAIKYCLENLV